MRTVFALVILPILFTSNVVLGAADAPAKALAITHVTVIDYTGEDPKPDHTVIIEGVRVTQVGPSNKIQVPAGADVVNAAGKYLIPGLWDMHVHGLGLGFAPLYVANGVTGVRDMGSPDASILKERQAIARGEKVGPRVVAALSILEGHYAGPRTAAVPDAESARRQVDQHKQKGADFIKVGSLLPRDAYFAILAEAKKQGLPVAGHISKYVDVREASDSGQKSVEHLDGYYLVTSSREKALVEELKKDLVDLDAARKKLAGQYNKANGEAYGAIMLKVMGGSVAESIASHDPAKANALCVKFARNGTWQCPTLHVLRVISYLGEPKLAIDPRLKYMPKEALGFWANDPRFRDRDPKDEALVEKGFRVNLDTVGRMHRAGVQLLAGTDDINPYIFPGFSLHDELAMLVRAGLTPSEALRAATSSPARFLGREKDLGMVEAGKLADLVLLDADPLSDIRNTTRIRAVVLDGKLRDRAALDKILAEAEADAHKK